MLCINSLYLILCQSFGLFISINLATRPDFELKLLNDNNDNDASNDNSDQEEVTLLSIVVHLRMLIMPLILAAKIRNMSNIFI